MAGGAGAGGGPNLTDASIPIAVEHPQPQAGMFAGLREEWEKLPTWGKIAVVGAAVGLGFIVYERLRSGGLGLPSVGGGTSGGGGGDNGGFGIVPPVTGGGSSSGGDSGTGIPDFPGDGGGGGDSGGNGGGGSEAGMPLGKSLNAALIKAAHSGSGNAPVGESLNAALINAAKNHPTSGRAGVSSTAVTSDEREARLAATNRRRAAAKPVGSSIHYALTAPTAALRAHDYAEAQWSQPSAHPAYSSEQAPANTPTGIRRFLGLD